MNTFRLLLLTTLAVPVQALAQQPASPAKALAFYVGRWTSRGQTRNAPGDQFIPVRTKETCSWVIGGHAVECRETVTTSAGPNQGIYLLAYDTLAKNFTVYGIDDTGMQLSGTGNVEPGSGKWSWNLQMRAGGQASRWRYDFSPTTRNSRSMSLLMEESAGKWTPMTNAVYTRSK
jgi:hypothetical protein